MELLDKLTILADAAKYDAACTSSGLDRRAGPAAWGAPWPPDAATPSPPTAGASPCSRCCSPTGASTTAPTASTAAPATCAGRPSPPGELAELTIGFYRRNYIEGLFLSSAVWGGPDRTTEAMIEALRLLREEYGFHGYIHAKAIPGGG